VEHHFQIPILEGANILIGFQKPVKPFGSPKGPMVIIKILILIKFNKNIPRKYPQPGMDDFSPAPNIYLTLGKIDFYGYIRMKGVKKFDIFLFRPGFYLNSIIFHRNVWYNKVTFLARGIPPL
jgi:hypothetical protein